MGEGLDLNDIWEQSEVISPEEAWGSADPDSENIGPDFGIAFQKAREAGSDVLTAVEQSAAYQVGEGTIKEIGRGTKEMFDPLVRGQFDVPTAISETIWGLGVGMVGFVDDIFATLSNELEQLVMSGEIDMEEVNRIRDIRAQIYDFQPTDPLAHALLSFIGSIPAGIEVAADTLSEQFEDHNVRAAIKTIGHFGQLAAFGKVFKSFHEAKLPRAQIKVKPIRPTKISPSKRGAAPSKGVMYEQLPKPKLKAGAELETGRLKPVEGKPIRELRESELFIEKGKQVSERKTKTVMSGKPAKRIPPPLPQTGRPPSPGELGVKVVPREPPKYPAGKKGKPPALRGPVAAVDFIEEVRSGKREAPLPKEFEKMLVGDQKAKVQIIRGYRDVFEQELPGLLFDKAEKIQATIPEKVPVAKGKKPKPPVTKPATGPPKASGVTAVDFLAKVKEEQKVAGVPERALTKEEMTDALKFLEDKATGKGGVREIPEVWEGTNKEAIVNAALKNLSKEEIATATKELRAVVIKEGKIPEGYKGKVIIGEREKAILDKAKEKGLPEINSTGEAIEFAEKITDEQLVEIQKRQKEYAEQSSAAVKAGDFDEAMKLASKAQFDREVYEAKTKTGGFAPKKEPTGIARLKAAQARAKLKKKRGETIQAAEVKELLEEQKKEPIELTPEQEAARDAYYDTLDYMEGRESTEKGPVTWVNKEGKDIWDILNDEGGGIDPEAWGDLMRKSYEKAKELKKDIIPYLVENEKIDRRLAEKMVENYEKVEKKKPTRLPYQPKDFPGNLMDMYEKSELEILSKKLAEADIHPKRLDKFFDELDTIGVYGDQINFIAEHVVKMKYKDKTDLISQLKEKYPKRINELDYAAQLLDPTKPESLVPVNIRVERTVDEIKALEKEFESLTPEERTERIYDLEEGDFFGYRENIPPELVKSLDKTFKEKFGGPKLVEDIKVKKQGFPVREQDKFKYDISEDPELYSPFEAMSERLLIVADEVTAAVEKRFPNATRDEKLKQIFGTTEDISETGFILPNGEMLDLSGKKFVTNPQEVVGKRNIMHEGLNLAEEEGLIRILFGGPLSPKKRTLGFDSMGKPTKAQMKAVQPAIDMVNEVAVDVYYGDKLYTEVFKKEPGEKFNLEHKINKMLQGPAGDQTLDFFGLQTGFERAAGFIKAVREGRAERIEAEARKSRDEFLTPVKGNSLDKMAMGYLKTGDFNEYIDKMPSMGDLNPNELFKYDPKSKKMIATIVQGGKVKPAVRKSGFHAIREYSQDVKGYDDISKRDIMWADPTRMIQAIDQGKFGGPTQQHVLWPSRANTLAKIQWVDKTKTDFADLLDKYKIGNKQKAMAVGRVMEAINKSDMRKSSQQILAKKEVAEALKKIKTKHHKNIVSAAKDTRILFDRLINQQNAARMKRKQSLIPYREFYRPWIRDASNLWDAIGLKVKSSDVMESPEMPDFIKPDAPFNARALPREALTEYPKVENIVKLVNSYIETAARDIFDTNTVQNNKVHARVLEGRGLKHGAAAIDAWTAEVFAGVQPGITKRAKEILHPNLRKGILQVRRNLTRAVFPLNWTWNMFVQTSSAGITGARYGVGNSMRGLKAFTDPVLKKQIEQNAYSHIIKSRPSGSMVYQDVGQSILKFRRLEFSKLDTIERYANFITNVFEEALTRHAVAAAYAKGQQLGLKGRALWEYASEGGAKTQSMYNYQDIPGILRAREVGAVAPFQTFAIEVFNTMREINFPVLRKVIGKTGTYETISAQSATGQALMRKRLAVLGRWAAAITVTNSVVDKAIGRKPWQPSSFVPFFALLTGGPYMGKGPIHQQYVMGFKKGVKDYLEYGDFKSLRRWMIQYHAIGGIQIERMIEGIEAVSEGGRVKNVEGETMFKIPKKEFPTAVLAGPYRTSVGKETLKKRREKLTLGKAKKKKRRQTIK